MFAHFFCYSVSIMHYKQKSCWNKNIIIQYGQNQISHGIFNMLNMSWEEWEESDDACMCHHTSYAHDIIF